MRFVFTLVAIAAPDRPAGALRVPHAKASSYRAGNDRY